MSATSNIIKRENAIGKIRTRDFKLCIDVKVVNGYIVINEVSLQLYLPNVFHFALSKNQVETIFQFQYFLCFRLYVVVLCWLDPCCS